jgi:hypothetical protein
MTKYECTQEEGILLFEASGFTVEVKDKGFYVYGDTQLTTKLQYHSDKRTLTSPVDSLKIINRLWRDRGIKLGTESVKKKFKTLMEL